MYEPYELVLEKIYNVDRYNFSTAFSQVRNYNEDVELTSFSEVALLVFSLPAMKAAFTCFLPYNSHIGGYSTSEQRLKKTSS